MTLIATLDQDRTDAVLEELHRARVGRGQPEGGQSTAGDPQQQHRGQVEKSHHEQGLPLDLPADSQSQNGLRLTGIQPTTKNHCPGGAHGGPLSPHDARIAARFMAGSAHRSGASARSPLGQFGATGTNPGIDPATRRPLRGARHLQPHPGAYLGIGGRRPTAACAGGRDGPRRARSTGHSGHALPDRVHVQERDGSGRPAIAGCG